MPSPGGTIIGDVGDSSLFEATGFIDVFVAGFIAEIIVSGLSFAGAVGLTATDGSCGAEWSVLCGETAGVDGKFVHRTELNCCWDDAITKLDVAESDKDEILPR
jgi:hypothetical protein